MVTATPPVTEQSRDLRLASCLACGAVSEITGSFCLPDAAGAPEDYVRTRCLTGHVVVVPAFALDR